MEVIGLLSVLVMYFYGNGIDAFFEQRGDFQLIKGLVMGGTSGRPLEQVLPIDVEFVLRSGGYFQNGLLRQFAHDKAFTAQHGMAFLFLA